MSPRMPLLLASLTIALLAPAQASACGEGIYAMRPEARSSGYLAPRPAKVLVYDDRDKVPESSRSVYRGLVRAGHTLEVARTPVQLAGALDGRRDDVVIAGLDAFEGVESLRALPTTAALLPVVPEGRATGDVRFRQRLKPGAGLGQYLRLIDTLMKDRR